MALLLAASGVIILTICTALLLAPFFGWQFKYDANDPHTTVDIPKSGRYTFIVRRHWRSLGASSRLEFSIAIFDARDETDLITAHSVSLTTGSSGFSRVKIGEFSVPHPGKYSIISHAKNRFADKDKIVIKKRVSKIKQLLLIIGITISPHMFTSGLAGGLMSFIGLITGIIILSSSF